MRQREGWEERDIKRKCVRRRRCTSQCTLMALHTAACVLTLIQYKHAVRLQRIKTVFEHCLKEEVHCAPLSVCFGKDSVLRGTLNILRALSVFPLPPEAIGLSGCVCEYWCFAVFVYLKHVGTNFVSTTNEQFPYHQSHLSRFCEL